MLPGDPHPDPGNKKEAGVNSCPIILPPQKTRRGTRRDKAILFLYFFLFLFFSTISVVFNRNNRSKIFK
jgi:hypothetical protein